jgi:hypothetical protein
MSSEKYIGLDVHQATISVALIRKARSSWSPSWRPRRGATARPPGGTEQLVSLPRSPVRSEKLCQNKLLLNFNRCQRDAVGTMKLHRMDYGSQNREAAAGNCSGLLRSLASNGDRTESVARTRTSGRLSVRSPIATTMSSQLVPDVLR